VRFRFAAATAALFVVGATTVASAATPPVPVHIWRGPGGSVCFAISDQMPNCVLPVCEVSRTCVASQG
jgi:hypothetical protein